MQHLPEDIINKSGLAFLRAYYRMRDRAGSGKTVTQPNVETEGGIIADGHLSFNTKMGEPFTATLEATSYDTIGEVKYKTQGKILAWDSFAIGTLVTAFVFSYSYAFNQFTIHKIGLIYSVILLLVLMIVMTALYFFMFRWMQRYRYIYAIEQFKKYHADEQWIAIGDSIFDGPENKYFKELKSQCVLNGFGLLSVEEDLRVQLLITPSRKEVFGKKRANLKFDDRNLGNKKGRIAQLKNFGSKIASKNPLRDKFIFKRNELGRYQKSFTGQILLSVFSIFLLTGIFYTQLQDAPFNYVDEQAYVDSLENYAQRTFPEFDEPVIDTAWVDPYKKEQSYLDLNDDRNTLTDIEAGDWDGEVTDSPLFGEGLIEIDAISRNDKKQVIMSAGDGTSNTYDCSRLYNMHGKFYLVQDNIYSSFYAAEKRIQQMNKKGIPLNAFCLGCLEKGNKQYVVHYDFFSASRGEAKEVVARYKKLLRKKGIKGKKVSVRSLEFE